MYHFSRSIYRELAPDIIEDRIERDGPIGPILVVVPGDRPVEIPDAGRIGRRGMRLLVGLGLEPRGSSGGDRRRVVARADGDGEAAEEKRGAEVHGPHRLVRLPQ